MNEEESLAERENPSHLMGQTYHLTDKHVLTMALVKSVAVHPEMGENCYLAENATVIGDVIMARLQHGSTPCCGATSTPSDWVTG